MDEGFRFSGGRTPVAGFGRTVAGNIEHAYLADGARRLSLLHRRAAGAQHSREPARVITMAWGERYVGDLLEVTVPALLAPGNLPVLAAEFDCEFVVVTETQFFDRFARSEAIQKLLRFADVRLVPVDDLLSPWYGITLTYALVRGFADLGAAMTDTHLIFLNADFVVADGSYRKLAEIIGQGERLVVSPSYCMDLERTVDRLRGRRDPNTFALSLSHRELAALVISHRHNTIRAKTVNQQIFRIYRYDQFYWYVNETTLLARQMPIAVVYMRPERVLTEMPTFWDYGVISEYCPTLKPYVLADSDDFLMGELRSEGTFRELLHLGWPTVDEIAADLSSFTTRDHRDYGRYTLVLHSDDLPADIDAHKQSLAEFVGDVYARLAPPIGYRDHPFWKPQFPLFLARHRQQLEKQKAHEALRQKLLLGDPREAQLQQTIDALRAQALITEAAARIAESRMAAERRAAERQASRLDTSHRRRRAALEREITPLLDERENSVRRLRRRLAILDEQRAEAERRQRDRLGGHPWGTGTAPDLSPDPLAELPDNLADAVADHMTDELPTTARLRLLHFYHQAFGRLPNTTHWHPYHAMLRPVMAAVEPAAAWGGILIVSSGGPFASLFARKFTGRHLTVTAGMFKSELYQRLFRSTPKFDLCLCDLAAEDLASFRDLLPGIRGLLKEYSRIVVFHHNLAGRHLDEDTFVLTRGLFPIIGRSRITFAGSYLGALIIRWYTSRLAALNLARPASLVALAGILAICAPISRLVARLEERRNPHRLPAHCTSMTIQIDLP
jgi:hypothetical protein